MLRSTWNIFHFSGKQKRYYRNSLEIVKQAANHWRGNDVEFVVQLGDIIDSKAKQHKGSEIECSKVLEELNKAGGKYLVNIIGNHELYNFKREELKTLLNVEKDGITWHSFKPWENVPIRSDMNLIFWFCFYIKWSQDYCSGWVWNIINWRIGSRKDWWSKQISGRTQSKWFQNIWSELVRWSGWH